MYAQHWFGLAPEPVQVVVFPLLGAEDVNDDIAVVEQQPAGVYGALAVIGRGALSFQAQLDVVEDRADLPLAVPGTDDKVVREAANAADVQQDDISRLLIAGYLYRASGYFNAFQS